MVMDIKRLQEIKDRLEKATPGPWKIEETNVGWGLLARNDVEGEFGLLTYQDGFDGKEDAEFCAAAPTDIADLVAEVEALRELAGRMHLMLCGMQHLCREKGYLVDMLFEDARKLGVEVQNG